MLKAPDPVSLGEVVSDRFLCEASYERTPAAGLGSV